MTDLQKQCLLNFLGYDTGGVDGIWGKKSRAAWESFRQEKNLAESAVEAALIAAVKAPSAKEPTDPQLDARFDGIRYWTPAEFKCRCGEYHKPYCSGFPALPDRTLLELADTVRAHFGRPGIRSSGLRCRQHNADSGGAVNSRHMSGKALDFRIEGKPAAEVLAFVQTLPGVRYAYAIDASYVHMDIE